MVLLRTGCLGFLLIVIVVIAMGIMLSGCVPGDGYSTQQRPAGFFWGIWHGWMAPISLILGIFDSKIRVYEVFNNGWAYDFGFYIAIISGFGGVSFFRKNKKK